MQGEVSRGGERKRWEVVVVSLKCVRACTRGRERGSLIKKNHGAINVVALGMNKTREETSAGLALQESSE